MKKDMLLSGFTSMSEFLNAEEVTYVMNHIFSILGSKVEKYNGMIDKFLGDCILCIFGIIDGNEPEKDACLCALEIMESIDGINIEIKKKHDIEIDMSIGINAGELVIGNIGYSNRMEFTVIGDTVNTASRIQHEANPGDIYISDSVYKRTKSFFYIESVGLRKLKNKKDLVHIYKLSDHLHSQTDLHNEIDLFGRNQELDILNELLEKEENTFHSVTIYGDSGVGKTTLVHYFCEKSSENKSIGVVYLTGDKYYSDSSCYPIKQLLKDIINQNSTIEGTINKDSIKVAFINFIIKLFDNKKSIVLFIDDIHNFDDDSIDIITGLQTILTDYKIIVIITQRDINQIKVDTEITIKLDGLDEYTTGILCERFLKNKIAVSVIQYVHQLTMGNPYYIYELINDFYENKTIDIIDHYDFVNNDYRSIPVSLVNIILQKIDKLDYEEKKILRYASLCGLKVEISLLKQLTNLSETDLITFYNKISLLNIATIFDESGRSFFKFTHQTAQEAISRSILDKTQQNIHLKIADKSLLILKYETGDAYEMIAYHYEEGNLPDKAVLYYFLSAVAYKNKFEINSAQKNLEKAIHISMRFEIDKTYGNVLVRDSDYYFTFFGIYLQTELDRTVLFMYYFLCFSGIEKQYLDGIDKTINCGFKNDFIKQRTIQRKLQTQYYFKTITYEDLKSSYSAMNNDMNSNFMKFDYWTTILSSYLRLYYIFTGSYESLISDIEEAFLKTSKYYSELVKEKIELEQNYFVLTAVYYLNKAHFYHVSGLIQGQNNTDLIIETLEYGLQFIKSDIDVLSYITYATTYIIVDNNIMLGYNLKSLTLAIKIGNIYSQSCLNSQIGYNYLISSEYDTALQYFFSAVDICIKAGYQHELSMAYYNMGTAYYLLNDYTQTIQFTLKSIEIKKDFPQTYTTEDWTSIMFPKTLLAVSYFFSNQYELVLNEVENILILDNINRNKAFKDLCIYIKTISLNRINSPDKTKHEDIEISNNLLECDNLIVINFLKKMKSY